jgi:hypothetical protein
MLAIAFHVIYPYIYFVWDIYGCVTAIEKGSYFFGSPAYTFSTSILACAMAVYSAILASGVDTMLILGIVNRRKALSTSEKLEKTSKFGYFICLLTLSCLLSVAVLVTKALSFANVLFHVPTGIEGFSMQIMLRNVFALGVTLQDFYSNASSKDSTDRDSKKYKIGKMTNV